MCNTHRGRNPEHMERQKRNATFHLTPECIEKIDETAKRWGISKSAVVEIAVRLWQMAAEDVWRMVKEQQENEGNEPRA